MISQMTKDLGADDSLDLDQIVQAMRTSWEAHGQAGTSRFNQQQANKLSVVKQAGNEPPQFHYQQQQRGEFPQQQHGGWGLGGGSKRGQ